MQASEVPLKAHRIQKLIVHVKHDEHELLHMRMPLILALILDDLPTDISLAAVDPGHLDLDRSTLIPHEKVNPTALVRIRRDNFFGPDVRIEQPQHKMNEVLSVVLITHLN